MVGIRTGGGRDAPDGAEPDANGVHRFLEAAIPPLSLLVAVGVFYNWAERLPVSIVVRQTWLRYSGVVAVVENMAGSCQHRVAETAASISTHIAA